jgi:acetylglutamate kinase
MSDFSDSTILIKIGGSTLSADDTSFADVATLCKTGARVVVVHGGGPEVTSWMAKMGVRSEFVQGLRVTDEAGLAVATAVLAGLINKRLAAEISSYGVSAVGLSGVDGGLLGGTVTNEDLGFVAGTVKVNPRVLDSLLEGGHVPVISPIGVQAANTRQLLNVNADTVAGAVAVAIGAAYLVFLTDVDGILDGNGRLIPKIPHDTGDGLIASGVVKGGMIPKLEACLAAGAAGISAHIVNGKKPGALLGCLGGTVTGTSIG